MIGKHGIHIQDIVDKSGVVRVQIQSDQDERGAPDNDDENEVSALDCVAGLMVSGWLVGWMDGWLVGWMVGWLDGWLVG